MDIQIIIIVVLLVFILGLLIWIAELRFKNGLLNDRLDWLSDSLSKSELQNTRMRNTLKKEGYIIVDEGVQDG